MVEASSKSCAFYIIMSLLPVYLLLDGLVGHDGDGRVLVVLPPGKPSHYVRLVRAHLQALVVMVEKRESYQPET